MKLNIYSLHKKYTNVQILWKHIKQLYKYVNPTKLKKKKFLLTTAKQVTNLDINSEQ